MPLPGARAISEILLRNGAIFLIYLVQISQKSCRATIAPQFFYSPHCLLLGQIRVYCNRKPNVIASEHYDNFKHIDISQLFFSIQSSCFCNFIRNFIVTLCGLISPYEFTYFCNINKKKILRTIAALRISMVTRRRFELRTHCLKGNCSAN